MDNKLQINRAVRCGVVPLIGVNGKSSGGKTKSALLLARGLVGPAGKICGIDTENGRMSHHADDPTIGGFDTIDLQPPFHPARYADAIKLAIEKGYKVVVVDSATHEWAGEGGCLEWQAQWMDGKKDGMKMISWNELGKQRAPFLNLILRCPIALILCFRVKDKVIMPKVDDTPLQPGEYRKKQQVVIEEDAPITRKDLLYEMAWSCLVEAHEGDGGGFFRVQKPGPDSLRREFEAVKSNRLSVEHGAAIARWCLGTAQPSNQPLKKPKTPLETAKASLWAAWQKLAPGESKEQMAGWLQSQKIIAMNQPLESLDQAAVESATEKVEAYIATNQT